MVYVYALIDDDGICIGISRLVGAVEHERLIPIPEYDTDYLWRQYDTITQTWSETKYEPGLPDPDPQPDPIAELRQSDLDNKEAIAALYEMLVGGGTDD